MKVEFSVGPEDRDKQTWNLTQIPERQDYINLEYFVSGYIHSKIWHFTDVRLNDGPDVTIVIGKWSEKEKDYVPGFVVDHRGPE